MGRRKYLLLIILSMTLSAVAITLCSLNDGNLSYKGFPLKQQWVTKLDGVIETLSTNGDQLIFVRTSRKLYALDVQSGTILWQHKIKWQAIPEPPIASNGMVYLADGKKVLVLDQTNGNEIWSRDVPIPETNVKFVYGNMVIVEIIPYIYVLNGEDGTVLWRKAECRYGGVQPYVDEAIIYSPCLDSTRAMKISTGEIIWETNLPLVVTHIAYQDGMMYYSPDRKTISALDLSNRDGLWKTGIKSEGFRIFEVQGSYLSVTGSDRLCIFKRETGNREFCIEMNNPQNPTVIGDHLFIFDGKQNHINVINILNGEIIGELSIRRINFLYAPRELMVTTKDILVFGNGRHLFAFE